VLLEIRLGRKAAARYPDWDSLLKDIARVRKGGKPLRAPLTPGASVLARLSGAAAPAAGVGLRPGGRPKTELKLRSGEVATGERTPERKPKANQFVYWLLALIVVAAINVIGVYRYHGGFRNWVRTLAKLSGDAPETPQAPPMAVVTNETAPAMPIPPPLPLPQAMSEREMQLQKQFVAAQRYERENPNSYSGVWKLYKAVQKDGAGTIWADKATIEIQRLETARDKAVDEMRQQLQMEVDNLVAAGKLAEAIALLRNYKGVFQKQTEAERIAQADRLQEQVTKERNFTEKIKPFLAGVAEELLRMDFVTLKQRLTAAEKDAVLMGADDCKAVHLMALKVAAMPEAVLESLKRDIGKAVMIRTVKGDQNGEIVSVTGDVIQMKKSVVIDGQATGFVEEKYRLADLTLEEWLRRLADNSIEQQLMRALLTQQSKASDKAREMFQQAGHPLGVLLAGGVDELQAAAAQREKTKAEAAAQAAYNALLRLVGPDLANQDNAVLPGLIRRTKISNELRAKLQPAIQTYWIQHGRTDWAKSNAEVINALAEAGTKVAKVAQMDEDAFDKALDKLRADNPGSGFNCLATLDPNGIVLNLRGSRRLTNLSALATIPIKHLILAGCTRLADISALAQLPLETINLDDTLVEDLSPLRGTPLKEVSLDRCKNLRSLAPLKDCPLQSLSISDCAETLDLTPVQGLPGIKITK
jgi:hypothetical protein